jgi:hypothetical protein
MTGDKIEGNKKRVARNKAVPIFNSVSIYDSGMIFILFGSILSIR